MPLIHWQNWRSESIRDLWILALWPNTYSSAVAEKIRDKIGSCINTRFIHTKANLDSIAQVAAWLIAVVPMYNVHDEMKDVNEGLVDENMVLIRELMRQWKNLISLWFTDLEIDHVLASIPWMTIEKLKEVMSHPQALRQCNKWLIRLEWIEVQTSEEVITDILEGNISLWDDEAAICEAQHWSKLEQQWYKLVTDSEHRINRGKRAERRLLEGRWFQDDPDASPENGGRYTIFSRSWDRNNIKNIRCSQATLSACENSINSLKRITRFPKNSTTAHIDELREGQAVLCPKKTVNERWLTGLDYDIWPQNNRTHFAIIAPEWTARIYWLGDLDRSRKITTIELRDPQTNTEIRRILEWEGVEVIVEKVETGIWNVDWDLFTWVLQAPFWWNNWWHVVSKVRKLGDVKYL